MSLYLIDIGELVDNTYNLDEMAQRLSQFGFADDAARETTELLLSCRAFRVRGEAIIGRLQEVWRVVERIDDDRTGVESLNAALAKYRGE